MDPSGQEARPGVERERVAGRGLFEPTPAEAVILVLAAAAACAALLPGFGGRPDPAFLDRRAFAHPIAVLEDPAGALQLLPGVGARRAARIVRARDAARNGAGAWEILEEAGLSPADRGKLESWIREQR